MFGVLLLLLSKSVFSGEKNCCSLQEKIPHSFYVNQNCSKSRSIICYYPSLYYDYDAADSAIELGSQLTNDLTTHRAPQHTKTHTHRTYTERKTLQSVTLHKHQNRSIKYDKSKT